jgi:hypothetical protein
MLFFKRKQPHSDEALNQLLLVVNARNASIRQRLDREDAPRSLQAWMAETDRWEGMEIASSGVGRTPPRFRAAAQSDQKRRKSAAD